ncbi:MAG: SDR family NAD(P)-dependent oxidoreductase [Elusimicrobia bacterium]|nr:SDR family NAD(P)-dependent oxidoreductase [Elusimicrobiota bacterium]
MNLSNNTVLITGGASGIGFELARQLSARGNKIVITGRDQARLDKALQQLPDADAVRSDVSSVKDIELLFERIARDSPETNVLINNAGIMRDINLHDDAVGVEDITREIDINLSGTIRMVKKFLPHLKTKPAAAIVNVSSGLAFVPLPISPVYCATKAALHSFTQSLRVQLQKTKVKVFELAPPATETDLLRHGDPQDLKGVSIMSVEDMVSAALKGMEKDQLEIRPGQANQLKFMSRLAPEFILKQLSRPVERMLSNS